MFKIRKNYMTTEVYIVTFLITYTTDKTFYFRLQCNQKANTGHFSVFTDSSLYTEILTCVSNVIGSNKIKYCLTCHLIDYIFNWWNSSCKTVHCIDIQKCTL